MRFLGIGDSCDLGALYLRLRDEGHEVRVHVANEMCQGTLAGMVAHAPSWEAELDWVREAGRDGIVLFENVAGERGALQDRLRADGLQVVGGSAYGDRLENDRNYAQAVLAGIGLATARVWEFSDPAVADRFLSDHPGRYVLKFNGPEFSAIHNYVGQAADGSDVRAVLAGRLRKWAGAVSFVLMERLYGVEMGVGAYFNGQDFIRPACLDWEHKRFFAGDLGELTGEMGTVVTYDRSTRFFERTLGRMKPLLESNGYCGYINLNTIVNEAGIWPLEFTCRFGYPGFAILAALQETPWSRLFAAMVRGEAFRMATHPGFALGLVLTTPPFPYNRKQVTEAVGLPVFVAPELSVEDRRHLQFGEVGLDDGELVTSGLYGWTMVVTGVAPTIAAAKAEAYRRASGIHAPNLRYRLDIGDKLIGGDLAQVERLGLLDDGAISPE